MITFTVSDLKKMNGALGEFCDELRTCNVDDDRVFESKLVSCELISNVLRHGGVEAQFTGRVSSEYIEITVTSECFGKINPRAELPDVFSESGRGLYIVRTLCRGEITVNGGEIKVILKRQLFKFFYIP